MMIYLFLFIKWSIDNKNNNLKRGTFSVPLRYEGYSPINLTIPVAYVNFNRTKTPILFFGPGNGNGNIPDNFDFATKNFPDNPIAFIGYRGIESVPSPKDNEFKSLVRIESKKIDDKLLQRIINKTLLNEKFELSDFWVTKRAQDVLHFLSLEPELFQSFHILAVGEDGTRIAHQVAATLSNRSNSESSRIVRIVLAGASVLSYPVPHNDTTRRLLAVIRARCRRNSTCPYKAVKWLPPADQIPKHPYGIFNVQQERIEFSISNQLRIPTMIPNALDILQSVTDGSSMGYVAMAGFSGPENMDLAWHDVALHVCAQPFDESLVFLPSFKLICPYLPTIEYFGYRNDTLNWQINQPMLIVAGEFDLPRPKTVIDFYKKLNAVPSLVDAIVLNLTSSRFEVLRPDVRNAIVNYLNDGNITFEIDPPRLPFKSWKNSFSTTRMMKFTIISGFLVSVVAVVFVYIKSNKEEMGIKKPDRAKEQALERWYKQQQQKDKNKKNN